MKELITNDLQFNFNFTYSPYLESFQVDDCYVIFDRDIFGIPKIKRRSWRRKSENFLKDAGTSGS